MPILTLKPDSLIVPDFDYATVYPYMGLNESGANIMSAPVGPQWPYQGFFGMGYYLYGTNLNTSFLNNWTTDTPEKIAAKAAIQTTWANRIVPWFVASPASDNTCTNAALRILNTQCYVLDSTTGIWSRSDNTVNNVLTTSAYTVGGFTGGTAAIRVMTDNINIPAFPFCPASADWAAPSSTTSKYRLLHGASTLDRVILSNPENVGGIMCVFESQLISTDGSALNGTPKFLVQAGMDAGYNSESLGSGALLGAPYVPAIAGSRWSLANTDGTRRKHYVGTFLHADSYQDLTSAYNAAGGVSKMTAAQFQANFPRRSYQGTL